MNIRLILTCLVVFFLFSGTAPATAGPFTGIVAFGDSLSDAGNDFLATGKLIPGVPYANGHFSNGPTWVEDLSQNLGLGPLSPSLAGGTDFAFGFAKTGPTVIPGTSLIVPGITEQVVQFLSSPSGAAPSTNLYTVWIGSNDVYQAVIDALAGANPLGILATAAQTEATAVSMLANAGARNFIIPLVPDLGRTPAGAPAAALATQLSAFYNTNLVNDIAALVASNNNITVHLLNTFSFLDDVIANPLSFGLTNVTNPCYTGPFTGGGSACPNPDQYLFWDSQHPTEAGHELIATFAEATAVPEPPMLPVLLAAGLFVMVWQRRRRTGFRGSQ